MNNKELIAKARELNPVHFVVLLRYQRALERYQLAVQELKESKEALERIVNNLQNEGFSAQDVAYVTGGAWQGEFVDGVASVFEADALELRQSIMALYGELFDDFKDEPPF